MSADRSLSTFGTILAFAGELEQGAAEAYRAAGRARLAEDATRRAAQVARMRRENVNEMILERIDGVAGFDWRALAAAGRFAELEERSAAFYVDAAGKGAAVLAEVAARFRRLAQGNRDHQAWLTQAEGT